MSQMMSQMMRTAIARAAIFRTRWVTTWVLEYFTARKKSSWTLPVPSPVPAWLQLVLIRTKPSGPTAYSWRLLSRDEHAFTALATPS
jgi:hypothetical protein